MRLLHSLLLSTRQKVKVAPKRRVSEIKLPRRQELPHICHELHGRLGTKRDKGCLGEFEDLRVSYLAHSLTASDQYQVLHRYPLVLQGKDSQGPICSDALSVRDLLPQDFYFYRVYEFEKMIQLIDTLNLNFIYVSVILINYTFFNANLHIVKR